MYLAVLWLWGGGRLRLKFSESVPAAAEGIDGLEQWYFGWGI